MLASADHPELVVEVGTDDAGGAWIEKAEVAAEEVNVPLYGTIDFLKALEPPVMPASQQPCLYLRVARATRTVVCLRMLSPISA